VVLQSAGAATWAVLDPEARTLARADVGLGGCLLGLDQMVEVGADARVGPAVRRRAGEIRGWSTFFVCLRNWIGLPLAPLDGGRCICGPLCWAGRLAVRGWGHETAQRGHQLLAKVVQPCEGGAGASNL
jgi:hypothetical protein